MDSATVQVQPDQQTIDPSKAPANVNVDGGRATVTPPADPNVETPQEQKILGKFNSQSDLEKAYTELERAFHSKNQQSKETPKGDNSGVPKIEPSKQEEAAAKGIDMAALSQEFSEKGGLSDETYTKLAEKGFDRATVDTIIEGQKAIATKIRSEIATVAGGEQQLDAVVKWAGDNLPDAQLEAYNAARSSGNVELVKLALAGIVSAYTAANPSEPNRVAGVPAAGNGGAAPFASNEEVVRAMSDPKYKTDPAYRAQVAARLAKS